MLSTGFNPWLKHHVLYFNSESQVLYGKIMFKVCRISETIGKFIKEL